LRQKWPKLAAFIDDSETDVLPYLYFPEPHRSKLHSTNALERLNKEVKRRTGVAGIFPNEAAIIRLIGGIARAKRRVAAAAPLRAGRSDGRAGCRSRCLWHAGTKAGIVKARHLRLRRGACRHRECTTGTPIRRDGRGRRPPTGAACAVNRSRPRQHQLVRRLGALDRCPRIKQMAWVEATSSLGLARCNPVDDTFTDHDHCRVGTT
jgi:hypothetical protein